MNASATALASTDSPDLLAILAQRRAQARCAGATYSGGMAAKGTMLYWLATAAKELRETAGRKQVHIAASMSKDQSTVYRFEQGGSVPRDLDLFIAAYADDLDIKASQIWERALQMWKDSGEEATIDELMQAEDAVVPLPQPGSALRPRGKARSTSGASRRQRRNDQAEAS